MAATETPGVCAFCEAETTAMEAVLADIERRAPPESGDASAPRFHTTAVLLDLVIRRLYEDMGNPMRVGTFLLRRALKAGGLRIGPVELAIAPIPDGDVQPTTADVEGMSAEDLAGLKDLPSA